MVLTLWCFEAFKTFIVVMNSLNHTHGHLNMPIADL